MRHHRVEAGLGVGGDRTVFPELIPESAYVISSLVPPTNTECLYGRPRSGDIREGRRTDTCFS